MKLKRTLYILLACAVLTSCIITQTNAAEVQNNSIRLEDMACELVNPSNLEPWEEWAVLRTSGSINGNISAHSISVVSPSVLLQARGVVTFNCSYSPSSAIMDFGVIDSNGRFYYTSVKGGSINQTIRISQAGNYQVAIRNNSSYTVGVMGFVNY